MTRVTIYRSKKGDYKRLVCSGHADFAEYGSDIVCASISVLVINTLNAMEKFAAVQMKQEEKDGFLDISFLSPFNEKAEVLMDALLLGLDDVKRQYGKKFLDLKIKEV
ncbi:MAG: ribosomal-processing cysteine protease Prp [Lachnospiraceae bacterium]|nr:ribosomal-processing cysteine protease Prp [Lachnospiraceae bacterium]